LTRRAVVDASVALSWVLPGECFRLSASLRERAVEHLDLSLLIPPTFWYEVANSLWVAVRRGRLERDAAHAALEALLDFRLEIEVPHPLDCLAAALASGIAVYDAVYLQLALESGSELWTVDRSLRRAAVDAGVRTEPPLAAQV